MKRLQDAIKERILVLDGAMGSLIQEYHLTDEDYLLSSPGLSLQAANDTDLLCLTRPDVITDIHERYLKAGADIITTNTFNAQAISQADYHAESLVADINRAGARLARQAADRYSTPERPRFVAGSVGPTNKACSMSPDVADPARRDLTYDQLLDAYSVQMEALMEGGVDALLIETIFDTLNAKAAIAAALGVMERTGRELPVMLSVTIADAAGRTLSGQTLEAFLASVSSFPVFSVGLNCSFGAKQMLPYLRRLAAMAPCYVSAYPNAGLPNALGLYDETPQSMAPQIAQIVDEGLVNIIGGCCGTTPDFIALYPPIVEGRPPRRPAAASVAPSLLLSGLDLFTPLPQEPGQEPLLNTIGERCNVAGSRKFLRLINEHKYDEALEIARKQVNDGARVIDINMDDALLDAQREMVHFVNLIAAEPDIARVPMMIDSSKWDVITAALKCAQGKCIVNSISLKEGEAVFLQRAREAKRLGAAIVVMLFDEEGQATTYQRRIDIAARAYRLLTTQADFPPQDIIFDPNVLAVATGMEEHNAYAADFIEATRWIRQNLPGCHVSGGISNLSFAFRGNNYLREAMHAVFLHHACRAGLDFAIVNPATKVTYDAIPDDLRQLIEDVILNTRPDAADRLIEASPQPPPKEGESKAAPVSPSLGGGKGEALQGGGTGEALQQALITGNPAGLEALIAEALKVYPRAVDIIEGPLMDAMNEVGQRFGRGEMFLPQVVKTARTMKQAVGILQPYIEQQADSGGTTKKKKVLLATVKGDVHDIGKNIVGVVMACNGYEVIDMGVMVPAQQIVDKAISEHVDMIGLSGLITPSLEEMVNVAKAMEKAGLSIPIMIGGATTSQLHVALKIAPVYGGPVVWTKDASQNPLVAQQLMADADQVHRQLDREYEDLRQQYNQKEQQKMASIEEARRQRLNLFDSKE